MKEGEAITVDQPLLNLNVSKETYLLAIRSGLNPPTIFLKWQPNELCINNYNASCLSAWRANMDIQFVLDACAMYIVSYKALLRFCKLHVMKPEKEMLVLSNKSEIWAINSWTMLRSVHKKLDIMYDDYQWENHLVWWYLSIPHLLKTELNFKNVSMTSKKWKMIPRKYLHVDYWIDIPNVLPS